MKITLNFFRVKIQKLNQKIYQILTLIKTQINYQKLNLDQPDPKEKGVKRKENWLSITTLSLFLLTYSPNSLLQNAIDFHIHSAPDITSRSLNDLEVAKMASELGMKAIVLKNHVTPTADRAVLAHLIIPDLEIFGGIVLNQSVGGLNPRAIEVMYQLGQGRGKIVWMPTIDAAYHQQIFQQKNEGIKIIKNGQLIPEIEPILTLIAQDNLILATGHISPEEIALLVSHAQELGVKKILITHAMADLPGLSLNQMQKLANQGVFLELTYVNDLMGKKSTIPDHKLWHRVSIQEMAKAIKTIGAEHFILSTDLGRSGDPLPGEGYQIFIKKLLNYGISETEINLMITKNPAYLLDI
jgi:hypothetical protein